MWGTVVESGATVVLAALGIVSAAVAALVWALKFLLKEYKESQDRNTAAILANNALIERNIEVAQLTADNSSEQLLFMKKLNGRLPKLVEEKKQEAAKE